jgi:hypothetical protein
MLQCFGTVLNYGLMSGGGMMEYIDYELGNRMYTPGQSTDQYMMRFLYGLLFFILVLILLLNIIFGIIIDQFASLREDRSKQEKTRKNQCFICGLERKLFDHDGVSRCGGGSFMRSALLARSPICSLICAHASILSVHPSGPPVPVCSQRVQQAREPGAQHVALLVLFGVPQVQAGHGVHGRGDLPV